MSNRTSVPEVAVNTDLLVALDSGVVAAVKAAEISGQGCIGAVRLVYDAIHEAEKSPNACRDHSCDTIHPGTSHDDYSAGCWDEYAEARANAHYNRLDF